MRHPKKAGWENKEILRTVLNKSCKQYLTNKQQDSHLPPIAQSLEGILNTTDEERTTFFYGLPHIRVDLSANTYVHQLCKDTSGRLQNPPKVIAYWDGWWESEGNLYCLNPLMMMINFRLPFRLFVRLKLQNSCGKMDNDASEFWGI